MWQIDGIATAKTAVRRQDYDYRTRTQLIFRFRMNPKTFRQRQADVTPNMRVSGVFPIAFQNCSR